MAFNFSGKNILITGVGRGIGRGLAIAISESGGKVFGINRTKKPLDSLVKEYPSITPIQVDLADWDATRKEAENVPVLDGLVNNAGIYLEWVPSVDARKVDVEHALNVNLMSALNLTQIVSKKMMKCGAGGSIVNVSSITGIHAVRECLAYTLSKAALDMMTRQFALELGPYKIRVNSVNPTLVYTDMAKMNWSEGTHVDRLRDQTPLGRFNEVNEVVGPIMYLLSDVSSMVTGTLHTVDGGFLSSISV